MAFKKNQTYSCKCTCGLNVKHFNGVQSSVSFCVIMFLNFSGKKQHNIHQSVDGFWLRNDLIVDPYKVCVKTR